MEIFSRENGPCDISMEGDGQPTLTEQLNELVQLCESDLLAQLARDALERKKRGGSNRDDPVARRVLAWLDGLGDPLTVYREIVLKKGEPLDMQRLGRFWSGDKSAAASPFGRIDKSTGERLLLVGSVDRRDVDERETIATWKRYPGEREVRLKAGAKIKVSGHGVGRA